MAPVAAAATPEAAPLPTDVTGPAAEVLARVNGVAITRLDVKFALRGRIKGDEGPTPEQEKATLESLISKELAAQKALTLGMERDPTIAEDMAAIEVQRHGMRREKLAEVYYRRQVAEKSQPSDADLKALWERDKAMIQSEYYIEQLFSRREAQIKEAQAAVTQGASFGEAYVKVFGAPPAPEAKPWDLGYLKYNQMPQQWRAVVPTLALGEASQLLSGPNNRFWLIRVVQKRSNAEMGFEQAKPMLLEELAGQARDAVRAKLDQDLLAGARIERVVAP